MHQRPRGRHNAGHPPLPTRLLRVIRFREARHVAARTVPISAMFPPRPAPAPATIPMQLGERLAAVITAGAR